LWRWLFAGTLGTCLAVRRVGACGGVGAGAVGRATLGGVGEGCASVSGASLVGAPRKILDSWTSAEAWSDVTAANGEAGVGCWRAKTKFCAATIAASADDVLGISKLCGKN
jgi:hypothetical protein